MVTGGNLSVEKKKKSIPLSHKNRETELTWWLQNMSPLLQQVNCTKRRALISMAAKQVHKNVCFPPETRSENEMHIEGDNKPQLIGQAERTLGQFGRLRRRSHGR